MDKNAETKLIFKKNDKQSEISVFNKKPNIIGNLQNQNIFSNNSLKDFSPIIQISTETLLDKVKVISDINKFSLITIKIFCGAQK